MKKKEIKRVKLVQVIIKKKKNEFFNSIFYSKLYAIKSKLSDALAFAVNGCEGDKA